MIIDIIGAGIGGLTTAIALKQKGIQARVYEQASEIKPVGAGIILANNAMQVYDKLGLKEELERKGQIISSAKVTDAQLNPILSLELKHFEDKYKVKNVAIHRGVLQQTLHSHLSKEDVYLDHKLSSITGDSNGYNLSFENGNSINSEAVLGADGMNSTVRRSLFTENKIRNSYQICWRGVLDYTLPQNVEHEVIEAWGGDSRFGYVPISKGKVYWFAVKSFKKDSNEFSFDDLGKLYQGYDPLVQELIQSTDVDGIHTAILEDLAPIKAWYKNNVCLIGDAAHATTPNMGQGACQSIEDAYILSECLAKYEVNQAFAKYQKLRIDKAHHIVNTSWRLGKVAHWSNPVAMRLRNTLLKMTPTKVSLNQSEQLFQLAKV